MKNFTLLSILMFNIGLIFNINDITINSSPLNIQNTQSSSPCSNYTNNVRNEEGWTEIGDVAIRKVTNDNDNGDGNGDGAIEVISISSANNVDKGIFYTFDCVMVPDQILQIETVIFNTRSSYVVVDLQLYNSTDNRVIASETETILAASTKTVSIRYTTEGSDEGDQLQLRYLRNDDGNRVRVFSIDRVTINGATLNTKIVPAPLNPACVRGVGSQPDIPLGSVTQEEVAQAQGIYDRRSKNYLGRGEMKEALLDYDKLNIVKEGNEVNGNNTSYEYAGKIIGTFARYLNSVDSNDQEIIRKASKVVELVSQQFCRGIISVDENGYNFRNFSRPIIYHMRDYLSDGVKDQFGYVLWRNTGNFRNFWGNYKLGWHYNTDNIYNKSDQLVLYGGFRYPDNGQEQARHMKGVKQFLERFLTYSYGTGDGVKVDGAGFHHGVAYDEYMYAFKILIDIIESLNDTSFQIDKDYYYVVRDVIYAQKLMSNDAQMKAFSMVGRHPDSRGVSTGKAQVLKLAIAGGKILGLNTADPVLAGYYNRVWGMDSRLNFSTVSPFEEGFLQINSANAGIYRKDNWVSVMKGFNSVLWGSEIYVDQNRYGRYQSYGALEILYPGRTALEKNGYDSTTWDWNYNPGTTTIVLPWEKLHAPRSRVDERQKKDFVGSLSFKNQGGNIETLKKSFGTFGLFAMDFESAAHGSNFTFKKSNFAFDDFIVCLGSDIANNDAVNPTITTLYQRMSDVTRDVNGNKLKPKDVEPTINHGARANNSDYNTLGETSFPAIKDNWVVNTYGTGFYVVSGSGVLKLAKRIQQTPNADETYPAPYLDNNKGEYIVGYLDHGVLNDIYDNPVPENSVGYEYLIKPNSTASEMQAIMAEKPYTVLEKSSARHIVKHNKDDIWGYALFSPSSDINYGNGVIKGNDAPCLVMYQELDNNNILLSMTDPNPRLKGLVKSITKNILLTLYGDWSLSDANQQLTKVSVANGTTTFKFAVKHALAIEVKLVKNDTDTDGVVNDDDLCPNTPFGATVNLKGCQIFTLVASNYLIYTISETCRNSNNGKINISVVDEMNYTATVTGTNGFTVTKTFTDKLEVDSLNAGIYSICFTVDKQSDYKQCFDLVINEPEDLSVSSKIDISLKRVSLSLKGADVYFVRLNETTYKTSDKKLQLQLKPGINTISVETAILCQGKFEEGIFVSEEIKYFPNPVESELFIYCAGVDTEVEIAVYDSLGRQLYIEPKKIGFNRVIKVPTNKLIPGVYVVSVKGKTTSKIFKIIK